LRTGAQLGNIVTSLFEPNWRIKLGGTSMKLLTIAAAVGAALAIGASANAAEFVVNGEFTSLTHGLGQIDDLTQATGWTSTGYNFVMTKGEQAVDSIYGTANLSLWDAHNIGEGYNSWNGLAAGAGNFVAMDGAFSTGPISQTITDLNVGSVYTLTFNWAGAQQYGFDGATTEEINYSLGSDTFATATLANPSHGFTGWQTVTQTFTATSATEVLSFLANGTPAGVPPFSLLSNVSLTGLDADVPEPATWTMMILGIGGIGAMARRRRTTVLAAA
jgi:hypothetical protein